MKEVPSAVETQVQETRVPFVSVVVPVYNGVKSIASCIESLLQQNYPADRYEVIIVNNNSADGTVDVVARYPVNLIHECSIQTSYAARNKGIREASGEIVAFTDADCVAAPTWLLEITRPFAESSVVGVAGKVNSFAPSTMVEEFSVRADPLGKKQVGAMLSMVTANVAYRHSTLVEIGGFQDNWFTGADVELGLRIQQLREGKVCYSPRAVVYHRHRKTIRGLARQYHRYGFSEVWLDAFHREKPFYPRQPKVQLNIMRRQLVALCIYPLSFVNRLVRSVVGRRWNTLYVTSPLLSFVADSSNLAGKIRALLATRCFTKRPCSSSAGNYFHVAQVKNCPFP